MQVVPLFVFVLPALIIGLTIGRWFKRLGFIKRLKAQAKQWDAEEVALPAAPITLKRLRNYESMGDKTVIAHYLVKMAGEVENKIRSGIFKTTFVTFTLIVSVAVVLAIKDPAAQQQHLGVWAGIAKVFNEVPAFFVFPVGFIWFAIESVVIFLSLHDQSSKFNHLLEEGEGAPGAAAAAPVAAERARSTHQGD